jgi:alanine racemase
MSSDPAKRAGAILDIDLGAIVANWRLLAKKVAPASCAAVIKANGYGLGAAPVARALLTAGCGRFFVATLDEGIALRQALGPAPVVAVFNGPLPGSAAEFAAAQLTPVLNDPAQIEAWGSLVTPEKLPPLIHIDTGLSRLGLSLAELATCLDRIRAIGAVGLISHLACADTPTHALNTAQYKRFVAVRRRLPDLSASLAASSGIFLGADFHFDEVRPGAALYGVNPLPGKPNPMRPVVRLAAKIVQIRKIDSGESVGYGASHVMDGPGLLATASIGEHYGVDDAAADAGTIGYEVLTSLGARYHRIYREPQESTSTG